ncbi:hypothetical protein J4455_01150 [Candidatus Woesearchaeota archaeon]|nr:hypothetical protein [Candidatus Woesearchaeota archaeon]
MARKEIIKKPLIKKKRKWYKILGSQEFNNPEIGETLSSDPNLILKKTTQVYLNTLTNDPKNQNIKIIFSVNKIENDIAYSELIRYELVQAFIRRVVRRDRNKIDDSFIAETKDNLKVRIKPIVMTKNQTKGIIVTKIRKEIRDNLLKNIKTLDLKELFMNTINHSLQNSLRESIKKIYPIASCEVRILEKL